MTRGAVPTVLAIGAVLLVGWALLEPADSLSPQSLANQHFAKTPRYATALSELSRVWPPLYPSVLWLLDAASVPAAGANLLLFAASVALLVPVGRRVAPGVHPAWWAALYGVAGFHVTNLQQLVSEALLIPLALASLWAMIRCVERGSPADYATVAALLAACCLTRYFALAWLVPVAGLTLALRAPGGTRARVSRAAVAVGVSTLPVLAWMLHARLATGYVTGMDRFAPRVFDAKTTLLANLSHTWRTLFLDWFVPGRSASHEALGRGWTLDLPGVVVAVVALGLLAACAVAAAKAAPGERRPGAVAGWLTGFSVGYVVCLIVLWTAGNNDPIHSRFLYPSYVFFGLAAVHAYSRVKSTGTKAARRPFQALYAWMLVSQTAGTVMLSLRGGAA